MAPKVIMLENSPIKTEIYCIGIIFYFLAKRRLPFTDKHKFEIVENIQNAQLDTLGLSENLKDLLCKLLQFNPNERIGMEELFNHRFLNAGMTSFISHKASEQ